MKSITLSAVLAASLAMTPAAFACAPAKSHGDHANHEVLFKTDYALTDHRSQPATTADYAGLYQIVYFGFTNCPDICPIGLDLIYQARDLMPAELRDQTQPILITVDPERDTPEAMADYVAAFDEGLIGMTGSKLDIAKASRSFGVFAVKDHTSHHGDYNMNHTSLIYVIGPDGSPCGTVDTNRNAEQLKEALVDLML